MAENIIQEEQTSIVLDKKNEQQLEELGLDPNKAPSKGKKETRGGARAGAGRPKGDAHDPKITLSLYVSQRTKDIYTELKKRGINPSKMIEDTFENMAKMLGI